MKFLLAALCVSSTFFAADAIKCYTGSGPQGPFNATGLSLQECISTGTSSGGPWCVKDTQGPTMFYRYCSPTAPINEAGQMPTTASCYAGSKDSNGYPKTSCICNTDSCNSSSAIGVSVVLIFLLAAWNLVKLN
ncbi:hypothetical protein QR680_004806 [Steinernema hermaphroditum]|uniref:Protein sleepless n=1 Tax=Steinernema hermaphroditum TaxID=289476 RepID=A0AA39HPW4_9BILA|nr:hypothetical protein QR680_004806 [Steinernema hermaphroditum]